MSEQGNPRRITCDGCGRSQEVDNEPMIEIDGLSEDERREIAKSFGVYEIAAKDARIAELEEESTLLNRIVNLWDKACDIAESHLQGYVNVGDSLFNGIPKLAAERDELLTALEQAPTRDALRDELEQSFLRGTIYKTTQCGPVVDEAMRRLFPTPDPADAEENS